jgi:hypothetical protein
VIGQDPAPFATAELRARHRVEKDFVVAQLVELAGRGIFAWNHAESGRCARLDRERNEIHLRARIAQLDRPRQLQRRALFAGCVRLHEVRIEQVVQLVIPRNDGARHSTDEQVRCGGRGLRT